MLPRAIFYVPRAKIRSTTLYISNNQNKKIMNAGQTNIAVGTKVKIVNIKGEDSKMNGLTGTATHPSAFGCTDKGWLGIHLDISGKNFKDAKVNVKETEIEII